MALAQGSGELIWWPYIIAKYGLGFLCLLIPACLLQFPLTFEIGRYTVLTGEGVFRGFVRLSRSFGVMLWVLFTLSFLWFGAFASAGGTAIAKLTNISHGWSHEAQSLFWAQVSIVVFTLAIVYAKTGLPPGGMGNEGGGDRFFGGNGRGLRPSEGPRGAGRVLDRHRFS